MKRYFISFGSEDVILARHLHEYLNDLFQGMALFSLSDIISPSTDWQDQLRSEVNRSDGGLFVLTPQSIERPWVNIELGVFWGAEKSIFPLLAGGLTISNVHRPFSDFQATHIEESRSMVKLIRILSEQCGKAVPPVYHVDKVCQKITAILSRMGAFRTIQHAVKKIECLMPESPLEIKLGKLSHEPRHLAVEILRSNTLQVTGKIKDSATITLDLSCFPPADFLILQTSHTDRLQCNYYNQMVKVVVNNDPVLAYFETQRHRNDSQYVTKQDGFFAYDLREIQTENKQIVELVFWKCELEKVQFRFYLAQIKDKNGFGNSCGVAKGDMRN